MVCIQDPVFHIPVVCIWGATSKQFNAVLQKHFDIEVDDMLTDAGVFFAHQTEHGTLAIIGLSDPFNGAPDNYSILSHELLHCVFHMLKDRGIPYSSKSEETYTYVHSFLLSTLATEMLKVEEKLEKRKAKKNVGEP